MALRPLILSVALISTVSLPARFNSSANCIGIAWTPGGGKTVIRTGYTLSNYLEGTGTNLRLTINPPFAVEHDNQYSGSGNYKTLPGSTLPAGGS